MRSSLLALLLLAACTPVPGLDTFDTGADLRLDARSDAALLGPDGGLGLRTRGWAVADQWRWPDAVEPSEVDPQTRAYAHDGLRTTWTQREDGVEVGWVVDELEGASGTLEIALELEGAEAGGARDGIGFIHDEAGLGWRVSAPRAWDATGRELQAWMDLDAESLTVAVASDDAVWPVTVDPVLTTVTATLTSGSRALGYTVDLSGDINNDGYNDLIASSPGSTTTGVMIYLGSASGVSTTGASATSGSIYRARYAGDVNGDGYDDVIAGDIAYGSTAGAAYLFYGSASGLESTPSVTITLSGGTSLDYFGSDVDGAGDVNKDGYDDVVVAAYYASSGKGAFYLFKGSASGLATTPSLSVTGSRSYGELGYCLRGAGDINKDGYDDVIVSAPGDGSHTTTGTAYIYYGSSSGLSSSGVTTLTGTASTGFGYVVGDAGDVNGDGYDDVAVGAISATPYEYVRVYYGSSSGISSSSYGTVTASSGSIDFGAALSGLGDVDDDGYDDLAVGTTGGYAAYVYSGSSAGIETSPTTTLTGTSSVFGNGVTGGDASGDGLPDLAVAASNYSSHSGKVYVYLSEADRDGDGIGLSTDCDDSDSGVGVASSRYRDADGDGYGSTSTSTVCPSVSGYADTAGDCDDSKASVYPGATEVTADGVDQDCDSGDVCYSDADRDGYSDTSTTVKSTDLDCTDTGEAGASTPSGDCKDSDSSINPGKTEVVGDEIDQNCDGKESCYVDADGDGYGPTTATTVTSSDTDCDDSGEAIKGIPATDCDDSKASVYPGATETTGDGIDGNCDSKETCYVDADRDGYRVSDTVTSADSDCSDAGEALSSTPSDDCDDTDSSFNPGATEIAGDEIDQDCDGGELCFEDADEDGYPASGGATVASEDTECDADGELPISDAEEDCDDSATSVFPGRPEVCNDIDDDCDGAVDSPSPIDGTSWYPDADGDGYTLTVGAVEACDPPAGYAAASAESDCNDVRSDVHPGAADIGGNGVDENCDGTDAAAEGDTGDSGSGDSGSGDSGGGDSGGGDSGGGDSGGNDSTSTGDSGGDGGGDDGWSGNSSVDDTGLKLGSACACATPSGGAPTGALAALAVLVGRRRRRGRA